MRQELRAWLEDDGLRVCRDVDGQPEHLRYLYADYGRVVAEWEPHQQNDKVPCMETMSAEQAF